MNKNLYGSKQAGRVWYQYLKAWLKKTGFKQSETDECVFLKNDTIFIVYVNDTNLIGTNGSEINKTIDEGDLHEYLGIEMEKLNDGQRKLTQPTFIKQILDHVKVHHSYPKNKTTQKNAS